MHFTLWPSLTQSEGGYAEINWPSFVDFVRNPTISNDRERLEGWSPAKFTANQRLASACELLSAIVLDDDKSNLSIERVCELWADVSGIVHTSHSSTPKAPRYRIVLQTSRDMSPGEHARIWAAVRDVARNKGQTIDEATKDPSRLWFVPACREGAEYECRSLVGEPLNVDAILAEYRPSDAPITPAIPTSSPHAGAPADRRQAMALALGSSWPAKGRHKAQLALAGALRAEGFTAEEAVEFLCTVCRTAGNEDRPKREATVRHTYSKPAGSALTGWTRLKSFVDPVVVDAARGALGREAEWNELAGRRLAEAAAGTSTTDRTSEDVQCSIDLSTWGQIDWAKEDPPVQWVVGGAVQEATVSLAFGKPNSLKTWTCYLMASCVGSGRPWLGRPTKQGLVVILDYESSERQARRRMKLLKAMGLENVRYINPNAEALDNSNLWKRLENLRPALVIVDSLSRGMLGRDENDPSIAIPLAFAKQLARAAGTASIFIHHKNKNGKEGQESARGSGAIMAAAEGWLEFLDFKKFSNGVQQARLTCGRLKETVAFEDIVLELSDVQGLVEVKDDHKNKKDTEESTVEKNRDLVLQILRMNPAGIQKKDLVNVMKGKREHKFELLSQMVIGGITREPHLEGRDYVMLNPSSEQ